MRQRNRDQASRASLTGAGRDALSWAIARQPLWGIGFVVLLDDQHARAHAHATFPAIGRPAAGRRHPLLAGRPHRGLLRAAARMAQPVMRADWLGEGRGHPDRVGGQDAPQGA